MRICRGLWCGGNRIIAGIVRKRMQKDDILVPERRLGQILGCHPYYPIVSVRRWLISLRSLVPRDDKKKKNDRKENGTDVEA